MGLTFPRGHLISGFQTDEVNPFRTKPNRGPSHVHGNVAAYDNDSSFADLYRLFECRHPQQIRAADHTVEVFSFDSQASAHMQAGREEHSLVTLVLQVFQRHVLPEGYTGAE